jgi:hypothetical protein
MMPARAARSSGGGRSVSQLPIEPASCARTSGHTTDPPINQRCTHARPPRVRGPALHPLLGRLTPRCWRMARYSVLVDSYVLWCVCALSRITKRYKQSCCVVTPTQFPEYLHGESQTESVEKERGGCWMQNLAGTQGVRRARDDMERIAS